MENTTRPPVVDALRAQGRRLLAKARSVDAPDFEPAQQRAYERLASWQEKYPDVHVTREVVRDHPSRALLHARTAADG